MHCAADEHLQPAQRDDRQADVAFRHVEPADLGCDLTDASLGTTRMFFQMCKRRQQFLCILIMGVRHTVRRGGEERMCVLPIEREFRMDFALCTLNVWYAEFLD